MKSLAFIVAFFATTTLYAQIPQSQKGTLDFRILNFGIAAVVEGTSDRLDGTPTRTHGWLQDLQIVKVTDSIPLKQKQNFGIVYQVDAKDTIMIAVDIEWIFPVAITNEKGASYKSVRYTTKRPTNIPSGSTYSLDEPYEMVKGEWVENIYIGNQKVGSKTFFVY
ncbi:DUF3859 domain-containing protein [Chitinophaga sp. Cy-1792]|uniref:DUF3859 domain-containing protein n=1 Tax=Chitinophaga sp. Cy-1792 TaxID=2608339 RepID=UPI00141FD423|nr:DUF3859 domain-containing protein [Chitinophaga sp. Cy-1792]NIG57138.1 DUF3859 domain-containing protein [Chitinophaga sp. Cy-1792]